jgi:hypothetical protein
MTSDAAPSPAWFGVLAFATFAGLVIVAFASGRHLVADLEPRGSSVLPSASAPARVRARPDGSRAEVRAAARTGKITDRLMPEQPVTVLETEGEWHRIRYGREGQSLEGWIRTDDLSLPRD